MSWVSKKTIEEWYSEWKNMPEYEQENLEPFRVIKIQFETQEDVNTFAKLVGAKITPRTKGIWFPPKERKHVTKIYVDEDEI